MGRPWLNGAASNHCYEVKLLMPYDEDLAARARVALSSHDNVTERKMFGGLCLMLNGNMCVGVERDRLMARVGPDGYEDALSQPGATQMDFTGRPLKGFVYVSAEAISDDHALAAWVDRCARFAGSLPAK